MILENIKEIRREQPKKQVYGSPRITAELNAKGIKCSKNRIGRIMRANGISAKLKRKFVVTTNSRHKNPIATNLLQQRFNVSEPDTAYVSDITYIPTTEGWLYLATIMDLFSRKIVGWSTGAEMSVELITRVLNKATNSRKPRPGAILHSDRGSQYTSILYCGTLKQYGYIQSMSGSGNCYDNAVMESFFHTLKTEWVSWYKYKTRAEATSSIFDYIETFYNRERRHSKLGYLSPDNYEKHYAKICA